MVFPLATLLATVGVNEGKRAKEEERKEKNFRHCRIADLIKSRAANFPRKTELKVKEGGEDWGQERIPFPVSNQRRFSFSVANFHFVRIVVSRIDR